MIGIRPDTGLNYYNTIKLNDGNCPGENVLGGKCPKRNCPRELSGGSCPGVKCPERGEIAHYRL